MTDPTLESSRGDGQAAPRTWSTWRMWAGPASAYRVLMAVVLLALALVPVYASLAHQPFYLTLFGRILIFAIAAVSLDLILGFGGLVSFGHALYLGLGAYTVGILSQYGIVNGWIHLLVTIGVATVVAVVTGAIVLRTSGIAFIMITLAFAQMFYFLAVSLKQYGGDDGLPITGGSDFGAFRLADGQTLYYTAFVVLCAVLFLGGRLVHARFGMALQGIRINERRMRALGFATLRIKLCAYVISAVLCAVAGMLYGNLTQFASPSYMAWTASGELIVMTVVGGAGTLFGPVVGALATLLTEEGLKSLTEHWMIIMGPLIVAVVLLTRRGLLGALRDRDARRGLSLSRPTESSQEEAAAPGPAHRKARKEAV